METIKAKPTTYRGVRFRSKSEARMAVSLDLATAKYVYEPQLGNMDKWLPDFLVSFRMETAAPFVCLMEYKPSLPTQEYIKAWEENARHALEQYPFFAVCALACISWYPEYNPIKVRIVTRQHADSIIVSDVAKMFFARMAPYMMDAGNYRFDLEDGE